MKKAKLALYSFPRDCLLLLAELRVNNEIYNLSKTVEISSLKICQIIHFVRVGLCQSKAPGFNQIKVF
jgi:hypothetical protein